MAQANHCWQVKSCLVALYLGFSAPHAILVIIPAILSALCGYGTLPTQFGGFCFTLNSSFGSFGNLGEE
jgi:hypothetical protein